MAKPPSDHKVKMAAQFLAKCYSARIKELTVELANKPSEETEIKLARAITIWQLTRRA